MRAESLMQDPLCRRDERGEMYILPTVVSLMFGDLRSGQEEPDLLLSFVETGHCMTEGHVCNQD